MGSFGSYGSMGSIREMPGMEGQMSLQGLVPGSALGFPPRLDEANHWAAQGQIPRAQKRARGAHVREGGAVAEGAKGTSLVRPFHKWGSNTRQLVMLRQYWHPGAMGFTAADMERLKRHCGLEISSTKKSLKRHKAKCEKKECLSVFTRFALLGPPMRKWEWGHPAVREHALKNEAASIEFLKKLREAQMWFLGRAKLLVQTLCANPDLAKVELDAVVEGGWAAFSQTENVGKRLEKDLKWIHSELVKDMDDISSILAQSDKVSPTAFVQPPGKELPAVVTMGRPLHAEVPAAAPEVPAPGSAVAAAAGEAPSVASR